MTRLSRMFPFGSGALPARGPAARLRVGERVYIEGSGEEARVVPQ
jgi:hypothetical protein